MKTGMPQPVTTAAWPLTGNRLHRQLPSPSLGIPELFDQAIDNMRQGMKAGVVQPRDLMERCCRSWMR